MLLEAHGITKHYGGVAALRSASFHLRAGEVHALMGENGAGKSTLGKILAGAVRPDSGTITIDGQPAHISGPLDAQRLGIGIIHQELDLFPNLTVAENLAIANLSLRNGDPRPWLDRVGLTCSPRQTVATLSIGQRQLLAIARALSMNARILIMDEPTSSLTHDGVERLFGLIRDLQRQNVATVYVSHKMDEIFRLCDRATVLRDGQTIQTVEMSAATPAEIIRLMVGRDLQLAARRDHPRTGDVLLTVESLTTGKLRGVSFELRRGEVLGIAGLVGAGRSELGAALFGLDPIRGGTVQLHGRLGLVPEDRRLEGLMMSMSVLENGTLAVLPRLQSWGFVRTTQEQREMSALASRLALSCPSQSAAVSTLSGGNQQKVLLARWLLVDPDVLFLDDPTRGIDVGAKQDIYRIIDELAHSGKGVIMVSSELPELLQCCDRILVLTNGRAAAVFDAAEATQEKIMAAAMEGAR